MQRITITIDDDLLATIDALCQRRGYQSRSEALRDIAREALAHDPGERQDDAPCLATLSYVYEHEKRDLSRRLTREQHHHHDLSVATLHVHLDNHDCLEVAVLRGPAGEVREFSNSIITQRGVRYGQLHVLPVAPPEEPHHHGHRKA